jgi:hypothetical protein
VMKDTKYHSASEDNNTDVDEEKAKDPTPPYTPVCVYCLIYYMDGALTVYVFTFRSLPNQKSQYVNL